MAYASAYRLAAAKVDMAVKFLLSQEEEVKSVVVYGLSYDNLVRREASELASILEAQEERYKIWLSDPFFSSSRVRVTFHGDLKVMFEKLPPSYLEAMQELEEKTSQYDWKNLFILIGYSGSRENETLSVKDVKPELPSIDLVIRTGGRARLSDALPYQTAYAELYVIDNFISDLEATDLSKALDAFGMVVRNLGS